eukprot:1410339-Rhodomonas_salina.1
MAGSNAFQCSFSTVCTRNAVDFAGIAHAHAHILPYEMPGAGTRSLDTQQPIMTAYKLVTAEFDYWPIGGR